ncbi:unnamed protein product [Urochloa humidicola]
MMAIDVSFLLEFLQSFSSKNNNQRALQRIPSRMSHLVYPSRRTSSHSMLLRDIGTRDPVLLGAAACAIRAEFHPCWSGSSRRFPRSEELAVHAPTSIGTPTC